MGKEKLKKFVDNGWKLATVAEVSLTSACIGIVLPSNPIELAIGGASMSSAYLLGSNATQKVIGSAVAGGLGTGLYSGNVESGIVAGVICSGVNAGICAVEKINEKRKAKKSETKQSDDNINML